MRSERELKMKNEKLAVVPTLQRENAYPIEKLRSRYI